MPHEHKCLYNAFTLFLNNNCPKAKMKAKYHEMNVRDWPIHQRSFPTCYCLACIAHVNSDIKESHCALLFNQFSLIDPSLWLNAVQCIINAGLQVTQLTF